MSSWPNDEGQCDPLALVADLAYILVPAGGCRAVLLKCDGTTVACSCNIVGLMSPPALIADLT